MTPLECSAATVSSRQWLSLLLALCSALPACQTYGSIDSLATDDARTPASAFTGRWRAPDPLRCREDEFGEGTRWSPGGVFDARGDDSGNVRVTVLPDAACPGSAGQPSARLDYDGALVRLGALQLLELSLSDEHLDESLLPLRQWLLVTMIGDTLFLDALVGDSLATWLRRSPTLTPHRFSPAGRGSTRAHRLVLTGAPQQLQSFARRAFAEPSVARVTIVLVRHRGDDAGGR